MTVWKPWHFVTCDNDW